MNDDKLTLYYYNDGLTNAERQEVASALASDAAVAERYRLLSEQLGRFADPRVAPPPSDMVERWHEGLDRAIALETRARPTPGVHSWSFLLGAAVTAALAIGIGVFISGDEPAAPPVEELVAEENAGSADISTAFLRGLQVHLRESEEGLAALNGEAAADRSMLIMNIIEQNRLFARAARQNEADHLGRVLRAFELVLVQLAAEDISTEDAEALRAKLLFELNVMLTKLSRDSSDEPQSI
jgi:hypothetical protein